MNAPQPLFDRRELRNALGAFPTGVTVATTRAASGAFVGLLGGCAACLECRLRSARVEGDHVLFIGRVVRFTYSERLPLVYFRGRYLSTSNTSDSSAA